MFRKKEKAVINFLNLTPAVLHQHEIEENRIVSILVPRFKSKLLTNLITSRLKSPFIKIKLDEFGSNAWLEINGEKKVSDISKSLLTRFGEKIQPVDERLTKYFNQLYNYKLIMFKELKVKGE